MFVHSTKEVLHQASTWLEGSVKLVQKLGYLVGSDVFPDADRVNCVELFHRVFAGDEDAKFDLKTVVLVVVFGLLF